MTARQRDEAAEQQRVGESERVQQAREAADAHNKEMMAKAEGLPPGTHEVEPGVRVEKKVPAGVPVVRVAAEPAEPGVIIIDERPGPAGSRRAELEGKVKELGESAEAQLMRDVLAEADAVAKGYRLLSDPTPRTEGPNPKDRRGQPSGEPEPETPLLGGKTDPTLVSGTRER